MVLSILQMRELRVPEVKTSLGQEEAELGYTGAGSQCRGHSDAFELHSFPLGAPPPHALSLVRVHLSSGRAPRDSGVRCPCTVDLPWPLSCLHIFSSKSGPEDSWGLLKGDLR